MTAKRGFVIGIDLGTTYSCAAIVDKGEVTIIKNELGQFTTPSHVAFESDKTTVVSQANFPKITVGDAAKFQSSVPPENSVYDVKRIIGRKFDDPVVQEDIHLWPFKVISVDNNPRIEVNGKLYHPEQISSMVLKYVKQQAELSLGGPVTDAVITVPAYFTDGQRQATKDAGSIAGLNVLRIINEPTAAAIAYNHQLRHHSVGTDSFKKKRNVLIFDLGGGTFDLSLLTMEGDKIEVKAVDGDTHLGGQDFDNKMVDYCIQQFQEKHNIDLSKCLPNSQIPNTKQGGGTENEKFKLGRRLRRIKNACELKKVHLSSTRVVQISLEAIYENYDLNVRIKRETFDSINKPYFEKCLEIVERILSGANMEKEEIDDVVLVGGSSRIPKVCKMVQEFFGGKAPCKNIKQDEAVAYGAAVQANIMTTNKGSSSQSSTVFTDVTPHSIGIKIKVDEGVQEDFSVILKKNTKVPCKGTKNYYTSSPNQKSVRIGVYEGQSVSVKENDLLGEFFLENLPPNCPQGETIDVFMELNEEGILDVKAECPASKAKNDITVKALKGRLKQEEVDQYQLRMEELFISTTTTEWGTILS